MTEPTPGFYFHFKGGLYYVVGVAKHSETQERLVVYMHLDGEKGELWVRPLENFLSTTPEGKKRFVRVEECGR